MDINVDMGESFGIYSFGADEELMQFIDVANVACGFHGSDFNHMRPPKCSTIWRLIGRPSPVPCGRWLASPPWRNFSNTSCC